MMFVYSFALALGLAVSAPWWGWQMLRGGRYREGLAGRLGRGTAALRSAVAGRRVVWVHAVSVGEVIAVVRLVEELQSALGAGWTVAVSTTTATGNKIAHERLAAAGCQIFWFPLDFAFAVRAYLRALQPRLLVLVEGELWPRMLYECERAAVPVAVVNARVSDRSYRRTLRLRKPWLVMARRVELWLAQGLESAQRLRLLGVEPAKVNVPGNLKYDTNGAGVTLMASCVRAKARGTKLIVAGSTLPGEEAILLASWNTLRAAGLQITLLLAPRHPQRFAEVEHFIKEQAPGAALARASDGDFTRWAEPGGGVILLDTLGDLAGVYAAADVAFLGGSLVPRGGHNPLEAARFGVPVVMGTSYENFREIVEGMLSAKALRVATAAELADTLRQMLADDKGQGLRGKQFYEAQGGATGRTVTALLQLLGQLHA